MKHVHVCKVNAKLCFFELCIQVVLVIFVLTLAGLSGSGHFKPCPCPHRDAGMHFFKSSHHNRSEITLICFFHIRGLFWFVVLVPNSLDSLTLFVWIFWCNPNLTGACIAVVSPDAQGFCWHVWLSPLMRKNQPSGFWSWLALISFWSYLAFLFQFMGTTIKDKMSGIFKINMHSYFDYMPKAIIWLVVKTYWHFLTSIRHSLLLIWSSVQVLDWSRAARWTRWSLVV